MTKDLQKNTFEEGINVRDLLVKYTVHWKWFLLSLVICMSLAYIYVRYTPRSYESRAKVLIKFEKGGSYSELYAFQDLGLFDGANGYNNIYNEKEFLSSRPLIEKVVLAMDLNIQYFLIGSKTGIERKEFYKNSPIHFQFIGENPEQYKAFLKYDISVINSNEFEFVNNEEFGSKKIQFGDTLTSAYGKFVISSTKYYTGKNGIQEFSIVVTPLNLTVSGYQSALKVEPVDEMMDVLQLSIRGSNVRKNNEFLDSLIHIHTERTISDQLSIYHNTTQFINDRIDAISDELADVEEDGEKYKTQNELSDVFLSEKSLYDRTLFNERSLVDAEIQLELLNYLYDFLNNIPDLETLIPANIGLEEHSINETVSEYNKIALERMQLLQMSSNKNPSVLKLDSELRSIKKSLKSGLMNSKSSLQLEVKRLRAEQSEINSEISDLPKHKRTLRSIDRQQQVKESLYLYLLQKREENEIASAVTEGNSKIIESAYSTGVPVSPNKKVYYAAAFFFGLFIPFLFIYARNLLDNKLHGKEDLEEFDLPFLANIPWDPKQKDIETNDMTSMVSEAVRTLRTNISFMLDPKNSSGKVIMLTSTVPKEGKSFLSIKLGASYASTGKKTIVVGLDLRAPKLLQYLSISEQRGVTNLMTDNSLKLKDLILQDKHQDNLSYLPSGTIPPNPAEILMRDELGMLIKELQSNYDIVIVDTAPVGFVADTLLISNLADICVFVTRAGYLEKKQLSLVTSLQAEKKLPPLGVVINAAKNKIGLSYGYGYGYGYGYSNEPAKEPIWKRFMKK